MITETRDKFMKGVVSMFRGCEFSGVVLQLLVIGIIKAFQFRNVIYFYLSVLQEVSDLPLCSESGSCHDLCLLSQSLPPSVSLFEIVMSQADPHTPPAVLLAECVSLGTIMTNTANWRLQTQKHLGSRFTNQGL